jgi:hypothetical protein
MNKFDDQGKSTFSANSRIIVSDFCSFETSPTWLAQPRKASSEMFGKDRLRDVIREHAHQSADQICRAVSAAVAAFTGDLPSEDDITLITLKARGPSEEASSTV